MKLLLFLSASHLHAQCMSGGKIAMRREFACSPEDREDFAAFLQTARHPTYLLTDLVEEDFRQEIVPHLSGSRRSALLRRKLEQFYRGTPFYQANLLKRQKAGRRDDVMLFSALTNPSLITPWLEIMLAQQTPLAGIYSVPQISAPLIKNHPAEHLLLISWEKSAGLRQTYFCGHRLQISRLTPAGGDLTFQGAVLKELPRTCQYLKNLSLLPPGQILDVRLVGHDRDLVELQLTLPESADLRYDFADLAEIASQFKMDHRFADSDASPVFMHQLAAHAPPTQYANAHHMHFFKLRQLKRTLNLASGVLLFGMALWGAANLWQSSRAAREAAALRIQAQHILDSAQKIKLAYPDEYAPATDIKAGVAVMRKLGQYTMLPGEAWRPVSGVLDRQPQIELDELAWQMNADEPVMPNTLAGVPAQTFLLKGRLTGFANDYRAALNGLEHFQHDLAAQGYQVTALVKPLDVSPSGSIADQHEGPSNPPGFVLKMTRRPSI